MNDSNHPADPLDPQRGGTPLGTIAALIGIGLSVLFLANPTFGLIEIPDNFPIVGNIDEVVATTILVSCLSRFGIHLPPNFDPKRHSRR